MIKNLLRIGVGVFSTLLALVLLWEFRIVVGYVFISLMLAASMKPLFKRLSEKSLFSKILWILTYILVMVALLFVIFLTVRASATEFHDLSQHISEQEDLGLPLWINTSELTILLWTLPPSAIFEAFVGPDGELVFPVLVGIAQNIGGIVAASVVTLILSIYWSTSQVHFERLWLSLLPSDQRKRARYLWQTIEFEIGAYIRGQGLLSLLVGFCLGFGAWLIRSPSPALLGLIGALASLVPMVGGPLIIISTLIIGFFSNTEIGILTGIYALIVLVVIQIWIKPKLFDRRWDNPILTVILMIALADSFGIVGIIIAPPISAILLIFWKRLVVYRAPASASTELSDLKERLAEMSKTIDDMQEPPPPLIINSMERISNLIAEAEPVITDQQKTETPNPPLPSK